MTPNNDDFRDAIAWLQVNYEGDHAARDELAQQVNVVGMVDALTAMFLGLVSISTNGEPQLYIDHMRANIDTYVDQLVKERS